ncbi:MAG: hypothetical protein GY952_18430 [Rhodobacteraceae bacterium]|nr:hypothetical protein [Paracoccaceae bacterium]
MLKPLVLAAAFVAIVLPAFSQGFGYFPELAQVSGVAADDHLNVRAKDSGASEDIGDLQPGAKVEVLRLDDSGKWANILWEEGNAWIAARYLVPLQRPLSKGGMPLGLTCGGTEPFWDLILNVDETTKIEIAGLEPEYGTLDWSTQSRNTTITFGFRIGYSHGVLSSEVCSDGMSDRVYGWAIELLLERSGDATLYSGCCWVK